LPFARGGVDAADDAPREPADLVVAVLDGVFREEWGRINAALIHRRGDWDLREECAQDAFAQALRRWPRDGVPDRPGAWLMTVARNGAIDGLRRSRTSRPKVEDPAVMAGRH